MNTFVTILIVLTLLFWVITTLLVLLGKPKEEKLTESAEDLLAQTVTLLDNEITSLNTLKTSVTVNNINIELIGTGELTVLKLIVASENIIAKLKLLILVYTEKPTGWTAISESLIRSIDKEQAIRDNLISIRDTKINITA